MCFYLNTDFNVLILSLTGLVWEVIIIQNPKDADNNSDPFAAVVSRTLSSTMFADCAGSKLLPEAMGRGNYLSIIDTSLPGAIRTACQGLYELYKQ
jgi:hypothetical protein